MKKLVISWVQNLINWTNKVNLQLNSIKVIVLEPRKKLLHRINYFIEYKKYIISIMLGFEKKYYFNKFIILSINTLSRFNCWTKIREWLFENFNGSQLFGSSRKIILGPDILFGQIIIILYFFGEVIRIVNELIRILTARYSSRKKIELNLVWFVNNLNFWILFYKWTEIVYNKIFSKLYFGYRILSISSSM